MVVVEAFSVGLPVVASAIGSLAEIVRPEENGLLFEPGKSDALTAVVNKLVHDFGLRRKLSIEAKAGFTRQYTADINLRKLTGIYERAIAESQKVRSTGDA